MNFSHFENDDSHKSLHDCYADRAYYKDGVMTFEFSDGFWVTENHPDNKFNKTVRTDYSKIEYITDGGTESDIELYVFTRNIFGQTVRKEWNVHKLVDMINNKKCELLFITQALDGKKRLIEGVLLLKHRPHSVDCMLKLSPTQVRYCWNSLSGDKEW